MNVTFKISKVEWLAGVVCVVVLLAVGVAGWPTAKQSEVTITILGITNTLDESQSVVFGVTNLGHGTISLFTVLPQVRTNGVWSESMVFSSSPIRKPDSTGLVLSGGQGTSVTVAAPHHGDAWRMPILWAYRLSRFEWYVQRAKNMMHAPLYGWGYPVIGPYYTNFSDTIELTNAGPSGTTSGSQPFASQTNRMP